MAFLHHDMRELNILLSNDQDCKITLIDYEFCHWDPLMFDLAYFINEHSILEEHIVAGCTKRAYFPENAPSDKEIETYVKQYYFMMHEALGKDVSDESWA